MNIIQWLKSFKPRKQLKHELAQASNEIADLKGKLAETRSELNSAVAELSTYCINVSIHCAETVYKDEFEYPGFKDRIREEMRSHVGAAVVAELERHGLLKLGQTTEYLGPSDMLQLRTDIDIDVRPHSSLSKYYNI